MVVLSDCAECKNFLYDKELRKCEMKCKALVSRIVRKKFPLSPR